MQELLVRPFVKIRLGIEAKCCNLVIWSENVLVLFRPNIISRQDGANFSPLLLLLQVLWLLVDTQPPISSDPERDHLFGRKNNVLILWKTNMTIITDWFFSQPCSGMGCVQDSNVEENFETYLGQTSIALRET